MTWETIFDGKVMGDHITVEWYIDNEDGGEFPVKVRVTDKTPPTPISPVFDRGSVIIPPLPNNPTKRYTFEYDNIDDMYARIASETGRNSAFVDALEKAIQNY